MLKPPNITLTGPAATPTSWNDKPLSNGKQFTWPGRVQRGAQPLIRGLATPLPRANRCPQVDVAAIPQHNGNLSAQDWHAAGYWVGGRGSAGCGWWLDRPSNRCLAKQRRWGTRPAAQVFPHPTGYPPPADGHPRARRDWTVRQHRTARPNPVKVATVDRDFPADPSVGGGQELRESHRSGMPPVAERCLGVLVVGWSVSTTAQRSTSGAYRCPCVIARESQRRRMTSVGAGQSRTTRGFDASFIQSQTPGLHRLAHAARPGAVLTSRLPATPPARPAGLPASPPAPGRPPGFAPPPGRSAGRTAPRSRSRARRCT